MLLSIIVPCYNAERTLQRCLSSIYDQGVSPTLFEVIAVDDGSQDATSHILKECQAANVNFKLISQRNQGVSAARNSALNVASGRFCIFLDADDVLGQHTLKDLVDVSSNNDDLIVCQSFCGQTEHYPWVGLFDAGTSYNPMHLIERGYIRGSACGVVFRTQMLNDSNLRFVNRLHYGEDTQFVLESMLYSRTISFRLIPLYQVVGRNDSVSRTFSPKRIRKHVGGLELLFRHIDSLEAATDRVDILAYMRYIPMSVLVADTLNTPEAGLSLLLRLRTYRFSSMLSIPQNTRFLRRKIQLLRLSLPLYYISVKLKQRKT